MTSLLLQWDGLPLRRRGALSFSLFGEEPREPMVDELIGLWLVWVDVYEEEHGWVKAAHWSRVVQHKINDWENGRGCYRLIGLTRHYVHHGLVLG